MVALLAPGCRCSSDAPPRAADTVAAPPQAPAELPAAASPTEAVPAPRAVTVAAAPLSPAEAAAKALRIERGTVPPVPPASLADVGIPLRRCLADLRTKTDALTGDLQVVGPAPRVSLRFTREDGAIVARWRGAPSEIWRQQGRCRLGQRGTLEAPCPPREDARVALVAAALALREESPRVLSLHSVTESGFAVRLRLVGERVTTQLRCSSDGKAEVVWLESGYFGARMEFNGGLWLHAESEILRLAPAVANEAGQLVLERDAIEGAQGLDPAIAQRAHAALLERLGKAGQHCFDAPGPIVRVEADGKATMVGFACHVSGHAEKRPADPKARVLRYEKAKLGAQLVTDLGAGTWWLGVTEIDERELGFLVLPVPNWK